MPVDRWIFTAVAVLAFSAPAFAQLGSNTNPNDPSSRYAVSPEEMTSAVFASNPRYESAVSFGTPEQIQGTAGEEPVETESEQGNAPVRCHWWSVSKDCR